MGGFLAGVGVIGIIVSIIWLIVAFAKKRRKRNPLIGLIGCFVLLVIGGALLPTDSDDRGSERDKEISQEETGVIEKKSKALPRPKREKTWKTIKSWEGTGMKKTEEFTIVSKKWRINWKSRVTEVLKKMAEETGMGGGPGHIFQLAVYTPGSDFPEEMLANVANMVEAGDVSYMYKSGIFYLEIDGANGYWKVTVEEER